MFHVRQFLVLVAPSSQTCVLWTAIEWVFTTGIRIARFTFTARPVVALVVPCFTTQTLPTRMASHARFSIVTRVMVTFLYERMAAQPRMTSAEDRAALVKARTRSAGCLEQQ